MYSLALKGMSELGLMTPHRVCKDCREYTPIGGDVGVCPWVDHHIFRDTPGCPHHKFSAEVLLPLIAERIRGKNEEEALRLIERELGEDKEEGT